MKFTRAAAIAVIIASTGLGAVQAANLKNADEPAEFPPSTFNGKQYVDSRGCVYIRAGIDGNVTWVPRVTRGRQHICGAKPSFAKAVAPNVPVIKDPAPKARVATAKPRVTSTAKAKPAAAPKPARVQARVVKKTPVVTQPKVVSRPTAQAPAKRRVRQPIPTIASITTPPRVIAPQKPQRQAPVYKQYRTPQAAAPAVAPASGCGGSAISRQYMGQGQDVRCGPQAEDPITYGNGSGKRPVIYYTPGQDVTGQLGGAAAGQASPAQLLSGRVLQRSPEPRLGDIVAEDNAAPGLRVAPRHVWKQQNEARIAGNAPEGYRPVWRDGRMSQQRAHQTFEGKAQMDSVWTETVPRRLIKKQKRAAVSRNATAVISTKSTAPRRVTGQARSTVKGAAGRSYVQVGTFGVEANARSTAQRLARSGLPVRLGTLTKGGKRYRIVLAGPFNSSGATQQALGTARRAGFRDAFVRR